MGSWGITERESDYGLDLLRSISKTKLEQTGFTTFNVADALDAVTADIMEEIRRANRGCSAEDLVFYFGINFPQNFTHGALLIAECLADYYRTGELIVTEYVGENYNPVDHHIKEFVVTPADLKILLGELQGVQSPEHELYQSWFEDGDREKWLAHIQSVCQTLREHSVPMQEKTSIREKLQQQQKLIKPPPKGKSTTRER